MSQPLEAAITALLAHPVDAEDRENIIYSHQREADYKGKSDLVITHRIFLPHMMAIVSLINSATARIVIGINKSNGYKKMISTTSLLDILLAPAQSQEQLLDDYKGEDRRHPKQAQDDIADIFRDGLKRIVERFVSGSDVVEKLVTHSSSLSIGAAHAGLVFCPMAYQAGFGRSMRARNLRAYLAVCLP